MFSGGGGKLDEILFFLLETIKTTLFLLKM